MGSGLLLTLKIATVIRLWCWLFLRKFCEPQHFHCQKVKSFLEDLREKVHKHPPCSLSFKVLCDMLMKIRARQQNSAQHKHDKQCLALVISTKAIQAYHKLSESQQLKKNVLNVTRTLREWLRIFLLIRGDILKTMKFSIQKITSRDVNYVKNMQCFHLERNGRVMEVSICASKHRDSPTPQIHLFITKMD